MHLHLLELVTLKHGLDGPPTQKHPVLFEFLSCLFVLLCGANVIEVVGRELCLGNMYVWDERGVYALLENFVPVVAS